MREIVFKTVGSIIDYETFPYYFAEDITKNTDDNNILTDFVQGFTNLSYQVLEETWVDEEVPPRRKLDETKSSTDSSAAALGEIVVDVTDIGKSSKSTGILLSMRIARRSAHISSTSLWYPYYCSITTECSEGLDYAPPGGYCVEFEASMKPSREFFEASGVEASFVAAMYQAINGGELYTAIVADNEDTTIRGMGSPGKGIPHDDDEEAPAVDPTM